MTKWSDHPIYGASLRDLQRQLQKRDPPQDRCWGCPPLGYPTDETRCTECPNRMHP